MSQQGREAGASDRASFIVQDSLPPIPAPTPGTGGVPKDPLALPPVREPARRSVQPTSQSADLGPRGCRRNLEKSPEGRAVLTASLRASQGRGRSGLESERWGKTEGRRGDAWKPLGGAAPSDRQTTRWWHRRQEGKVSKTFKKKPFVF